MNLPPAAWLGSVGALILSGPRLGSRDGSGNSGSVGALIPLGLRLGPKTGSLLGSGRPLVGPPTPTVWGDSGSSRTCRVLSLPSCMHCAAVLPVLRCPLRGLLLLLYNLRRVLRGSGFRQSLVGVRPDLWGCLVGRRGPSQVAARCGRLHPTLTLSRSPLTRLPIPPPRLVLLGRLARSASLLVWGANGLATCPWAVIRLRRLGTSTPARVFVPISVSSRCGNVRTLCAVGARTMAIALPLA